MQPVRFHSSTIRCKRRRARWRSNVAPRRFSPLALPLERLRTVRRISPALLIPHGGGSPALEGPSPLGLRLPTDSCETAELTTLPVEGGGWVFSPACWTPDLCLRCDGACWWSSTPPPRCSRRHETRSSSAPVTDASSEPSATDRTARPP